VPELAEVSAKEIHDPKTVTRETCGYAQPVIDYKQARAQALCWFKDNPLK
jgi:deoxyribodipyrimidine photo-lyase